MKLFTVLVCFFLFTAPAWTQEDPPAASAEGAELSREFFGINLSDGLEAVKDRLKGHPYFFYRGDPDVSFLPQTTKTVIDCEGMYYIKRGLFQFSEENLYIITLYLNPERVDYFSVFTALSKKYGRPVSLNPTGAVWQNGQTRLSLEKPLTFKYIDQETFEKLKSEGETQRSLEEQSRQKFIDSF
ncbi:MAG: hypothetical protein LBT68_01670 [Spirochaetales bacterium]|nr:hypothetical protein [Spirochaetales bacterium]